MGILRIHGQNHFVPLVKQLESKHSSETTDRERGRAESEFSERNKPCLEKIVLLRFLEDNNRELATEKGEE